MRQFRYSKISNFPNYADSWSSAILMLSNFKGSQFMHFLYTIHTSTINFYMSSSSFHYHLDKCTTFSFLFTISRQCRSLTDWLIDISMWSIFLIYPQLKKSKSSISDVWLGSKHASAFHLVLTVSSTNLKQQIQTILLW